jgi:hypothetical protein
MMETVNSLTKQEWNAAYFLAMEELQRYPASFNFTERVVMGAKILASHGYRFEHLERAPTGWFASRGHPAWRGEHDTCRREIANGTFDLAGRAREALAWISANFPRVSTEWLENLISSNERTHAEVAAVGSGCDELHPTP